VSKKDLYRIKKIFLLSLLGLVLFINPAYCYTWVKLGEYKYGTVWYEPTTIEINEIISSVLVKTYYLESKEYIVVWVVIDCQAKKYSIVNAVLVNENDKALDLKETELQDTIIPGSAAEDLYKMFCAKTTEEDV
jgi:hypothetical protein